MIYNYTGYKTYIEAKKTLDIIIKENPDLKFLGFGYDLKLKHFFKFENENTVELTKMKVCLNCGYKE